MVGAYVSAQVESPSHSRSTHVVSEHVTVEPPAQEPAPLHVVPYVHWFESVHGVPLGYDTAHVESPSHE